MFEAFLDGPGADGPGVLATSGKTLRRSFDRAAGRAPLHVVTGRRCTDGPGLPGLAMIACVPSGRQFGESTARRFHVSPARLTSKAVAKAAGTRRLIGNCQHRVLDMAFGEDRARNRKDNGAETLSLLRKLALNLLRKARPPQTPRFPPDANAQDGPATAQNPSSAKCDGAALRPEFP